MDPLLELFSSKGGIEKSLGRDEEIPREGRFAPTLGGNFQTEETISFPRMKLWTFLEM